MLEKREFEVKQVLEKDATTAGIIAGLEWLVADTKPGDIIVFHYSGHGSQLLSRNEEDGFEEIICPYDLNWRDKVVTDDTLRQIFDKVPNGVNVTLVLDCCHSGTMLDQAESTVNETRAVTETAGKSRAVRKKKGERFMKPPASVIKKLKGRELVEWSAARDVNATAMLIATSRADQTSADAKIDGIFQGAGTASLLKAINENPDIEYKQLIDEMNKYMIDNRYTQRPVLDGSFGLHKEKFLSPWTMFVLPDDVPVVPVTAPAPAQASSTPGKEDNTSNVIGIIFVIAVVLFVLFA